ncbi:MAG: acylphosphatase [Bryobacteraceae bacterium]|jgi:acylphosphatase
MGNDRNLRMSRRYIVRGQVQGVGFRNYAQRRAQELGVTGTVRNLDDGTVEVIANGTKRQLDALAGDLHLGPLFGEVRGVTESECAPVHARDFSIRY